MKVDPGTQPTRPDIPYNHPSSLRIPRAANAFEPLDRHGGADLVVGVDAAVTGGGDAAGRHDVVAGGGG